jgi:glycosyltransferase involved in cell wall biosynthesis
MTSRRSESERATLLLVSLSTSFGGAETYYIRLAKILQSEYKIVAAVFSQRLADEFRGLGIEVEHVDVKIDNASRYIAALRACRKMIRRYHPVLAHLNGQPESYLAPFLRLMALRSLTTRHTPFTDRFLQEGAGVAVPIKRWLVLTSLRFAYRTICVSKLLQSQLAAHLPAERLVTIPTWVEDKLLEPNERPTPSRFLRALFVGRIVENKGILDIIEALRLCPHVHLTVVGEGEQLEQARRSADGLRVDFVGFMQDCGPAYRSADVLLFASREGFEGLPQVPLEAMAMGLPCLASDIASVLEIAGRDVTAQNETPALALYRQGDPGDMARQLNSLAEDPALLGRLSVAGRQQVLQHFTVGMVRPKYLHEFKSAIQASRHTI